MPPLYPLPRHPRRPVAAPCPSPIAAPGRGPRARPPDRSLAGRWRPLARRPHRGCRRRRSGRPIPRVRWHRFEGPAVAAASYLLAAALNRIFWSSTFHRSPFVLFFGAVAVAAWFGGFWPGFGVALASAITVTALLGDLTPEIITASLVMIGVAALISYRSERSREVDRELEEANGLLNTMLD